MKEGISVAISIRISQSKFHGYLVKFCRRFFVPLLSAISIKVGFESYCKWLTGLGNWTFCTMTFYCLAS